MRLDKWTIIWYDKRKWLYMQIKWKEEKFFFLHQSTLYIFVYWGKEAEDFYVERCFGENQVLEYITLIVSPKESLQPSGAEISAIAWWTPAVSPRGFGVAYNRANLFKFNFFPPNCEAAKSDYYLINSSLFSVKKMIKSIFL